MYNGWKNYETWNVALWIDNDQGSYSMRTEWAQESWDDTDTDDDLATRTSEAASSLAKKIEDFVDENNPLAGDNSMFTDILNSALAEVDYYEIAENWLDDVEKDEAEEEETEDEPVAEGGAE